MNLTFSVAGPLQGSITLPGDKSLSHRAALFAALAQGESRIENFLVSGVTKAMLDALTALGVPYALKGTTLTVQGRGPGGLKPPAAAINCGNSATTIRLLAGALAMAGVPAVLDGSAGLRRRPMDRIVEPLRSMGVAIETTSGCAPLTLGRSSFPLRPLGYSLPVASAQVKTCLLLAALAAGGPSTLREPGPSRDHTERLLKSLGVSVTTDKAIEDGAPVYTTRLTPSYSLQLPPLRFSLPGDFSAAAFLIVAGLVVPGSRLVLKDVGLNPGRTGLLDALLSMGADICIERPSTRGGEPVGNLLVNYSHLHGTDISGEQVVRMIDEFPIFAVAAACAEGVSRVSDAAELRLKESDRISSLCGELRALGVAASESPEGFTIEGGALPGGALVDPHSDHRLAMSLAVAGLAARRPVTIRSAEIMAESFPEFVPSLAALGASLSQAKA
jgi:3-phosphoshikimate 1-carboxyvinyltransferase